MAGVSISNNSGDALFTRKKKNFKFDKRDYKKFDDAPKESFNQRDKRPLKCHRCGKLGHIQKFCRVKMSEGNVAETNGNSRISSNSEDEENWGKCFLAETSTIDAMAINFKDEWIVDSGCGHHLTGDESKFVHLQPHKGNEAMVTADNTVHQVEKEGTVIINDGGNDSITLKNVFHVPGMKKNLFSVPNAVDAGNFVLFGPKDVKFLRNIEILKADVVHTGRRVKDTFVLSASSSYIDKVSCNENASLWHARLGHVNMEKLKVMVQKNLVNGLLNISSFPSKVICEGCQFGKAHRLPFAKSDSRSKAPLECIHGDVMGPTRTPSFSGFRYMLILVDDFSRFTWVYFIKQKSEVLSKFQEFKETVEGVLGLKIKCLRIDNGGEFTSESFFKFCQQFGIRRQLSCAETPQQNGVAERKIRHLTETCRSWLHAKNLPKALWAESMMCAVHVINRLPLSPNNMKTPYELMFGDKPSVKHFKVFGSICYVHVPDSKRGKLDSKAKKCIFVGYDERKKGWRCMDPETHSCVVSRDVIFDEISSFYGQKNESAGDNTQEPIVIELPSSSNPPSVHDTSHVGEQGERGSVSPQNVEMMEDVRSLEQEEVEQNQRPKRTITKPARFRDENFTSTYSCFFAGPIDEAEPSHYEEAKDVKEWKIAMDEEMHALMKNETWDLVPQPENVHLITCKWVYRLKRRADGSIDRFKARLVARGFSQSYGDDYEETFSPVAKMTSVRVVISLAACQGWKLWQLDVKNAFLYGDLDKDIYMQQPAGYVSQTNPGYVCKLKKALYGLKQAPRAWYGKIAEFLQFCGYRASDSYSSLFVKKHGNLHMVVLLYVDDMIVTGSDENEIAKLRAELSTRFDMKNLGELSHFLGLEVQNMANGIFMSQQGYAQKLVERFGLKLSKKRSTPLDKDKKLRRKKGL
ncbi:hypothetical protein ACFX2I_035575 [Malus domestica]